MEYEIIKLSESYAEYRNEVRDSEWLGEIPGLLNGWSFEYKNAKGEYSYGSVSYENMMPEEYANLWHTEDGREWIHDTPSWNGWEPTGRVVFRGYAEEYYDPDEREWFVEPYYPVVEQSFIVGF